MAELPRETMAGAGVLLRQYADSDIPDVAAACNDPYTLRFLHQLPQPYRIEDAAWWVRVGAPAGWAAGGAQFAVADPATDRLIGAIGLGAPSRERGQAEVGYWVAPRARGRGVATAATAALSGWAHDQGFARLELLAEPENVPSQRVALAAGYRYEGIRRSAAPARDGRRHDLTVWTRLAGDPPGPAARVLPDLPGGSLTDQVVMLRPLRPGDAEVAYRHRVLPEVVATSVPPVPPDPAEVATRCRGAASRWLTGERADLVIEDAGTGRYAGEIGLYYQDRVCSEAMIGYSVAPAFRGRGYATRAVRLLAGWAIRHAGIARLVAGTDPENQASARVLEKAGFRFEAYQRGRLPAPDGGRADVLLYALLPGDIATILPGVGSAPGGTVNPTRTPTR